MATVKRPKAVHARTTHTRQRGVCFLPNESFSLPHLFEQKLDILGKEVFPFSLFIVAVWIGVRVSSTAGTSPFCKKEALWMLVWGIVGVSHTILYGLYRWIVPCSLANTTKGCENKKCCALFISSLCTMLCSVLFLVGWYIYGATLFLTSQSKSCDKIMYNFGYWMTLIVVILVALFVFGCCLVFLSNLFCNICRCCRKEQQQMLNTCDLMNAIHRSRYADDIRAADGQHNVYHISKQEV